MAKPGKAMTKTEVFKVLAERTGLKRKDVENVFNELSSLIAANLGADGPGAFTIPGLVKITVQHKEATPERKGINPFTGEETIFKAKPARNVVKLRALKALREMV